MRVVSLASPKTFKFLETETPEPKNGQVLIKLQCLSICGSDLRFYDRVLPEEEYPMEAGRPCHECAGVIEESRCDEYSPGQRVIVLPSTPTGLKEYVVESPTRLIALPEEGDLSTLLMCQPMGTVMYSCQQIGSVLGKRVVILGQGAIGLSFTNWMARQGARQIIVTDLLDYRLDLSRKLGATHTINPTMESLIAQVREITDGDMADVVVEAVGRPETFTQLFQVVRKQGIVALFGLAHDQDVFLFDHNAMMNSLATIIVTVSSRTGDPTRQIRECVDIVAQGRLDLSHLVTHRMPLDEVQLAYDLYSEKTDGIIKVVMDV